MQPLIDMFEEKTGITVDVRYGDSAELAATIAEEGGNSPADVFFSQDPGSLGAVDDELEQLPQETLDRVAERFRDAGGRWVGTSGRTRVLAYNTDALSEDQVPDSVFDLTDPAWKGKVGIAPTNASFQAFVTAMRLSAGEEKTKQWLARPEAERAEDVREEHAHRRGARNRRDRARARQPLLPLPRQGGAARRADREPLPRDRVTRARSSASPAPACSRARPTRKAPSSSSTSCSPTRASGSTRTRPRRPSTRSSPASTPRRACPPLDTLEGPDVDLSTFGAELDSTLELLRETGYLS